MCLSCHTDILMWSCLGYFCCHGVTIVICCECFRYTCILLNTYHLLKGLVDINFLCSCYVAILLFSIIYFENVDIVDATVNHNNIYNDLILWITTIETEISNQLHKVIFWQLIIKSWCQIVVTWLLWLNHNNYFYNKSTKSNRYSSITIMH